MTNKILSISYSLFGKNRNYYLPIVKQIQLFNDYFHEILTPHFDFEIVLFVDNSVDIDYFKLVPIKLINVEEHTMFKNIPPKMWRFYNVFFSTADVYLFRDSDSLITKRELIFLKSWLSSTFEACVIRDSRLHFFPIMAGTFSLRNRCILHFQDLLSKNIPTIKKRKHFYDQIYLAEVVYPKILKDLLVFSNFLTFKNENYIKTDYRNRDFIGGYCIENLIPKHWHDNKFLDNVPLSLFRALNFRSKLIQITISLMIIKKLYFKKNK